MPTSAQSEPGIREDVLHDPRYPVHKIADRLMPYLKVLVEQFKPRQVVLFGSYAYGAPDDGSDIDLLVVQESSSSPSEERAKIRAAWRPLHRRNGYLSFHLVVESPDGHRYRLQHAAGYYDRINRDGLRLA